jgi:hypothetical protein
MSWQLTRIAVLISLLAQTALGQPLPPPEKVSKTLRSDRATTHSIHWVQLPLGEAIARLESTAGAELFLDRRVDPNRPVDLSLADASTDEIVAALANVCGLGYARCGQLYYLGPTHVAARINTLAAMRRRDVAALSAKQRQSLLERRRIVWPRLTQPRDLVVRLMDEHGWPVEHGGRIPLDLWPAGELPPLALADQLTLLLAGFDRTYRILADQQAIEIVAVDWKQVRPAAQAAASAKRTAPPAAGDRRLFTLRVENQPVGEVLTQLAQRLGWKLTVDEAAIRAAGRSLDQRVSFAIANAGEEELLEALLAPAGLKAVRNGKEILVGPR